MTAAVAAPLVSDALVLTGIPLLVWAGFIRRVSARAWWWARLAFTVLACLNVIVNLIVFLHR